MAIMRKLIEGFLGRKMEADDIIAFRISYGFIDTAVETKAMKYTSMDEIEEFLLENEYLNPVVRIAGEVDVKYLNNQIFYTKAK